jgi:hypothetical protein
VLIDASYGTSTAFRTGTGREGGANLRPSARWG